MSQPITFFKKVFVFLWFFENFISCFYYKQEARPVLQTGFCFSILLKFLFNKKMISIVLKTCCWARLVDMNFQPVVHTSIIIKCFFTNIINIIHFILCFPFSIFFFLISWFLLEEYWAFIYPMTRDYQDHFQKISPFQFFSHIFPQIFEEYFHFI